MKIILTILCAIMVLFGGGCAIVLMGGSGIGGVFNAVGFAALPGGIAALNIAVLMALWGKSKPGSWVFVTLAILDLVVVCAVLLLWASFGLSDPVTNWIAGLTAAAFGAKGILTLVYLKEAQAPS
jgi:hypothetical protein